MNLKGLVQLEVLITLFWRAQSCKLSEESIWASLPRHLLIFFPFFPLRTAARARAHATRHSTMTSLGQLLTLSPGYFDQVLCEADFSACPISEVIAQLGQLEIPLSKSLKDLYLQKHTKEGEFS